MTNTDNQNQRDPAVELVRQKIDAIYAHEPDASEEAEEVLAEAKPLSKHQSYMKHLTTSGLSLADIQTKWHEYYSALPDNEKHEVWQEFYAEHGKNHSPAGKQQAALVLPNVQTDQPEQPTKPTEPTITSQITRHNRHHKQSSQTVAQLKNKLLGPASAKAEKKLTKKQHFQSLLFGAGLGSVVLLILLFSFFNERFIAPFITPSKQVSSTPIIIGGSGDTNDPTPKIIIPKINVEIPVVYDEPSVEENAIQKALERGVVHYATTASPGEKGNTVIFGHSSNNILNSGKYKFAFVLLNKLSDGDTFYLIKDGTRYAYKIYERKIVKPSEVGVLGNTDKTATATLITCDPPGTALNRLVVIGEQISPDPNSNKASTAKSTTDQPTTIPSNAPSLWSRFTNLFR